MPKGEGQSGKKRGPYKKIKEDVEIRIHKRPKERAPREDAKKLIVPPYDPDLDPGKYQKKPKKKDEEEVKEEVKESRISKIIDLFLKKQQNL